MFRKTPLKPGDGLALALVLLLTLLSAAAAYSGRRLSGEVRIRTETGSFVYPLGQERTVTVDSATGPFVVIISGGTVRVAEAHCPEQLCVLSPPISRPGESIACLPGRILITIQRKNGEAPDAEAW